MHVRGNREGGGGGTYISFGKIRYFDEFATDSFETSCVYQIGHDKLIYGDEFNNSII